MIADEYCQQRAAAHGSSLYYCTLFLDPLQRHALIAVAAFRQEIGDIVRNCIDVEPARAKLAWWRLEIGRLYQQHPDHPVTRALAQTLMHFPIAQEQLQEVIDGYEMDLDRGRFADFKSLQLYCYRVSSTISAISADILGYRGRGTAKFAHELGLALQLADIVRDVGLDARQGRLYLPLEELEQFGVSEEDILDAIHSEEFTALMAFQAQRIRALHDKALSLLDRQDRKSQRTLVAMAAIHGALLDEIERDGYHVLDRGVSLTPLRKLWIVTRTWLGA